MRRPSVVLGLYQDDYWGTLLDGIDGTNYWTENGIVRKKTLAVKKEYN